tara:strand:- start:296 stop:541 length:246 start_codon:yes stop_codon:yes gene_type:complete
MHGHSQADLYELRGVRPMGVGAMAEPKKFDTDTGRKFQDEIASNLSGMTDAEKAEWYFQLHVGGMDLQKARQIRTKKGLTQ